MLDRGAAINTIFFYLSNFSMILWITSQKKLDLKHLQTDQLLVLLIFLILQVKITVWKIRLKIIYALTCSCSLKWKLKQKLWLKWKLEKETMIRCFSCYVTKSDEVKVISITYSGEIMIQKSSIGIYYTHTTFTMKLFTCHLKIIKWNLSSITNISRISNVYVPQIFTVL